MNKKTILKKTEAHLRSLFDGETSGHDWWHIHRVHMLALHIGKKEKADLFVVELGALLHDIADFKFHGGDEKAGGREARKWLVSLNVSEDIISQICYIVDNVSFKGLGVQETMRSVEGKVVQDADRLEALGAIGIARTFAYGGHKGRPMYVPGKKPVFHKNFKSYKKGSMSGINHFYEKLLHLKDRMNTKTGKLMAKRRHEFMEKYLKEFFAEWGGKK